LTVAALGTAVATTWGVAFGGSEGEAVPNDRETGLETVPSVGRGPLPVQDGVQCDDPPVEVATFTRDEAGAPLPWIAPPEGATAASWTLYGRVTFGGRHVRWTAELQGEPPWEVALPAEAYFDASQQGWVSRIQLTLVGRDAKGNARRDFGSEQAWVVWPDGETPIVLDKAARDVEAPNGAWSPEAQATVPAELFGDPTASVAPPEGGAP
jgi:hypothetical protein